MNVLHALDDAEEKDAECHNFSEEAFVLPKESGEVDDLTFEIMDGEEVRNEPMSFIDEPKNKKSVKMHSRF